MNKIKLINLTIDNKGHYGLGASSSPFDKDFPLYLRITDIDDNSYVSYLPTCVDPKQYPDYNNHLLKNNDIVFARTGNSTGRNYFYDGKFKNVVFAGFLIKYSLDPKKVNPKYVSYYCQSQEYKSTIDALSNGSTRKNLNANQFGRIEIPLYSIETQQHIVDTIGSIDNKIEHNEKLISKIEEFLLLKFNKLEKTVGVVFSDVFRCFNGGTFKSSDYVDLSQYKLITIKNIDNTGFNTSNATYIPKMNKYEKYKLSIGDILLTMTGAYLGRLGIVDEDNCYLNQRVLKISGMSKSFLYCFLKYNQNEIFSLGKGSAQPNLSITDLNIFPVNYSHNTIKSFCFNDKYIDYIINLKQEIKKLKILKQNYLHKFFG